MVGIPASTYRQLANHCIVFGSRGGFRQSWLPASRFLIIMASVIVDTSASTGICSHIYLWGLYLNLITSIPNKHKLFMKCF